MLKSEKIKLLEEVKSRFPELSLEVTDNIAMDAIRITILLHDRLEKIEKEIENNS